MLAHFKDPENEPIVSRESSAGSITRKFVPDTGGKYIFPFKPTVPPTKEETGVLI